MYAHLCRAGTWARQHMQTHCHGTTNHSGRLYLHGRSFSLLCLGNRLCGKQIKWDNKRQGLSLSIGLLGILALQNAGRSSAARMHPTSVGGMRRRRNGASAGDSTSFVFAVPRVVRAGYGTVTLFAHALLLLLLLLAAGLSSAISRILSCSTD